MLGFPEWTEVGRVNGLDPLGMARPVEEVYQSLLPGISTITLRLRYYSFFPWILERYAKDIGSTDPVEFSHFQRRCEALLALIAARDGTELGVAGIDWATRVLAGRPAMIDFREATDRTSPEEQRYLRNLGGAFGGIYGSQMAEMDLVRLNDARIGFPHPSRRGKMLAETVEAVVGDLSSTFFGCVEHGVASDDDLRKLAPLRPSALADMPAERDVLRAALFARDGGAEPKDRTRRNTLLMLLRLGAAKGERPRMDHAKWAWLEANDGDSVLGPWALYQACDLARLAYEQLLDASLATLERYGRRGRRPGALVAEVLDEADLSASTAWLTVANEEAAVPAAQRARTAWASAEQTRKAGDLGNQVQAALSLLMALIAKAGELEDVLDARLPSSGPFQSLRTERAFIAARAEKSVEEVAGAILHERVLARHLHVAMRKFHNQKAYTFLFEPDQGEFRYRSRFAVSPSSPRIDQAVQFLVDLGLVDAQGLTADGREELVAFDRTA